MIVIIFPQISAFHPWILQYSFLCSCKFIPNVLCARTVLVAESTCASSTSDTLASSNSRHYKDRGEIERGRCYVLRGEWERERSRKVEYVDERESKIEIDCERERELGCLALAEKRNNWGQKWHSKCVMEAQGRGK